MAKDKTLECIKNMRVGKVAEIKMLRKRHDRDYDNTMANLDLDEAQNIVSVIDMILGELGDHTTEVLETYAPIFAGDVLENRINVANLQAELDDRDEIIQELRDEVERLKTERGRTAELALNLVGIKNAQDALDKLEKDGD